MAHHSPNCGPNCAYARGLSADEDVRSGLSFAKLCDDGLLDGDLNGDGMVHDLDVQLICESYEGATLGHE